MKRNRFLPGFASLTTGSYGAGVAQAAEVGKISAKTLTPVDRPAQVNQGAEIYKSPIGGIQGQIAVPSSIESPEYFTITIDTTQEDDDYVMVPLFDPQAMNNTCSCDEGTIGGQVYMDSPDCNRYDSLVQEISSTKIMLSSMRIELMHADEGARKKLSFPIKMQSTNRKGDSNKRTLNTGLFRETSQYNDDLLNIPLTGKNALLDKHTIWMMRIPKGLVLEFTFFELAETII